MLTIQLPSGKTAEFSVKGTLILKTSRQIITFLPIEKDDKYKSVITTIKFETNGSINQWSRKSEETCNEEFMQTLKKFEIDFSPHNEWIEKEPSETTMNRW